MCLGMKVPLSTFGFTWDGFPTTTSSKGEFEAIFFQFLKDKQKF